MKPIRIQRKRARGWKMPEGAIYVGRPTRWGNPWKVGLASCGCRSAGECSHNSFRCETAADAVVAFRDWRDQIAKAIPERGREYLKPLRGKNLACFCALDQPCHADMLLELANA